MRRAISALMLAFMFVSLFVFAFEIQPVKSSGTIYIRADGSIDPPTANITTVDNVTYYITDNITSDADGIVVERSNIIINGNGHSLEGTAGGEGVDLSYMKNVTVKGIAIKSFYRGIYLWNSSNNILIENNITGNSGPGIYGFNSSCNIISQNNITHNSARGIQLEGSSSFPLPNSNNSISQNTVGFNYHGNGIELRNSFNTSIIGNNVMSNGYISGGYGNILIDYTQNCSVIGNNIELNYEYGIKMVDSIFGVIAENNVTHRAYYDVYPKGIFLQGSQFNLLSQNRISDCCYGILISLCYSSNTLQLNNMTENRYNFGVEGYMDHYIQDVDETNIVDGKPIYYWVNKQSGQVPSDAGFVAIVNSTDVRVEGLNIENNYQGILIAYSNNTIVHHNNLTNNYFGIGIETSSNNSLYENNVTNSTSHGIVVYGSSNNAVYENDVTNNQWGISLEDSSNNSITENNITANGYCGIDVVGSSYNTISANNIANNEYWGIGFGVSLNGSSYNNTISGNRISSNEYGIWLLSYYENKFYHNNFIENHQQVHIEGEPSSINVWDDGYPSGGNYWSDYYSTDLFSGPYQNETGSDGIGDTPYVIDENNIDRYPIAGTRVSVMDVTTSKTGCLPIPTVGQGQIVEVNATIYSHFEAPETFDVTLNVNGTSIKSQETTISNGTSITVITFIWNTTDFLYGNYTISVIVDTVYGEIDYFDNNFVDGAILVTIPGDINGDQYVNAKDAIALGVAFYPSGEYNPNADINGDGYCNAKDAIIIGVHFNEHWE